MNVALEEIINGGITGFYIDIEKIVLSGVKAPVLYDPLNDSYVDLTVENIDGVSKIKFNVKSLETVVVIEK